MAGTFTATGSYSNLTRLELEQLRRADYAAGGKALTIGDSGLLPEGTVGKGSVNAEPFYSTPTLTLAEINSLTPPQEPGKYIQQFVSFYGNATVCATWFGPTEVTSQFYTGVTAAQLVAPDQLTDPNASFITNGVQPGDVLLVGDAPWSSALIASVDSETQVTATSISSGGSWGTQGIAAWQIIRPGVSQLFAVPGSGPLGQEQTFLFVTPDSTLHSNPGPSTDSINADRITNLVPPKFGKDSTVDRADAVYPSPAPQLGADKLGYRVVLYPDDGTGTGPDMSSPITSLNPVIDPSIPAADQRMTIDYAAGVLRFSCAPAVGGDIKVAGGVNGTTGRLNLYAVFFGFYKDIYTSQSAAKLYVPQSGQRQAARVEYDGSKWAFVGQGVAADSGVSLALNGNTSHDNQIGVAESPQFAKSLVEAINDKAAYITCGDGTLSFGDFSGATAIEDAFTFLTTTPNAAWQSVTIYLKPGSYQIASTVTVPAGKEIRLRGQSRETVTVDCSSNPTEAFLVTATGQLILEDVRLDYTSGNGIVVNGSLRARGVYFHNVPLLFTDCQPYEEVGALSEAHPAVAICKDCEFNNASGADTQIIVTQTSGVVKGFFFRDSTFFGNATGQAICKITTNAPGASTEVNGVFFEHCQITIQTCASTSSTVISTASGVVNIDPASSVDLFYVDNINVIDCDVASSSGNNLHNTILLNVSPLPYNAVTNTPRATIGTVRIAGGTWSVPASRGSDFTPFFLCCLNPIVERVRFIGGGTAADGYNIAPGYRGHGLYTDAQKWALRNPTEIATGAGQGFVTISAGGALLNSTPRAMRASGMTVRDITITNLHRQAGPAGAVTLFGPSLISGPALVDGVRVVNPAPGTAASMTNVPTYWIHLIPGGHATVNRGSKGYFRNIHFESSTNSLSTADDRWADLGIMVISLEGKIVVEDVCIIPSLINGTDPSFCAGISLALPWSSTDAAPLADLGPVVLNRGEVRNVFAGIYMTGVTSAASPLGPFYINNYRIVLNAALPVNVSNDPLRGILLGSGGAKLAGCHIRDTNVQTVARNGALFYSYHLSQPTWERKYPSSITNCRCYVDTGAGFLTAGYGGVYIETTNASSVPSVSLFGNKMMGKFGGFDNTPTNIRLARANNLALTDNTLSGGSNAFYQGAMTGHDTASGTQYRYVSGQPMVHNDALLFTP